MSISFNINGLIDAMTDSVSLEPLSQAITLPCSHKFNEDTAQKIWGIITDGKCQKPGVCPECAHPVTTYTVDYKMREIYDLIFSPKKVENSLTQLIADFSTKLKLESSSNSEKKEVERNDPLPYPGKTATYFLFGDVNSSVDFITNTRDALIDSFSFHEGFDGDSPGITIFFNEHNREKITDYFKAEGFSIKNSKKHEYFEKCVVLINLDQKDLKKIVNIILQHNHIGKNSILKIEKFIGCKLKD